MINNNLEFYGGELKAYNPIMMCDIKKTISEFKETTMIVIKLWLMRKFNVFLRSNLKEQISCQKSLRKTAGSGRYVNMKALERKSLVGGVY